MRRTTPHRSAVRRGQPISIHALREEGDLVDVGELEADLKFLSTPSARRATTRPAIAPGRSCDFYPRPPRGGRLGNTLTRFLKGGYFYPRPPRGGRPPTAPIIWPKRYFYPRPPRGGRQPEDWKLLERMAISIHALREEGDALRYNKGAGGATFLSTPSARRATHPVEPSGQR